MKRILVLCMLLVTFFTLKSQDLMNLKPTGYVNDYENIFTPDQKADLEKICSDYDKKTSIEICVVTSANFNLDYDTELANKWSIGKDGLDNGLLIIISKKQRDCSVRSGYGLEPFLPDGALKLMTNDIFPRTLSKDDFYGGIKELILTSQNKIGTNGYDFLVAYKKIQDDYDSQMIKRNLFLFLYFIIALIVLACVVYLVYRYYKTRKDFRELKKEIEVTLGNIRNLKEQLGRKIGDLPKEFEAPLATIALFLSDNKNLTNKFVTRETKLQINYAYNLLLNHDKMINTIDSTVESIKNSTKELEKYLQYKYPYCSQYLKNELNNIVPDTQSSIIDSTEYDKTRMTALLGIQSILDNKLKTFLKKTFQIDGIIKDKNGISSKVEELKNSHDEYFRKKTILSGCKIGNRYSSLVNLDFNTYLTKIQTNIFDSFNYLEKENYVEASTSYGNYITIIAVITGAFGSVDALIKQYNTSIKFLEDNKTNFNDLISYVNSKINKSGVSYSRKSTYEDIKKDISIYTKFISTDIIDAASTFKKVINDLEELLNHINSDISDHEASIRRAHAATLSSTSSSSRSSGSGFGGFGGGSFGGGGVRSGF